MLAQDSGTVISLASQAATVALPGDLASAHPSLAWLASQYIDQATSRAAVSRSGRRRNMG